MKKIFIGLSVIFAFALGFCGCNTDYVKYSGPDYIMFSDTLTVLPVQNNEEYFDIPVAATEACSYDRTLEWRFWIKRRMRWKDGIFPSNQTR